MKRPAYAHPQRFSLVDLFASVLPRSGGKPGRHHQADHPSRKHDVPRPVALRLPDDHVPEWRRGIYMQPGMSRRERRQLCRNIKAGRA